MYKMNFRFVLSCLVILFCSLCLIGCAISPAPISDISGNFEFAKLLEEIRQKEKLPAIAASVIIDGDIYAKHLSVLENTEQTIGWRSKINF